MAARLCEVRIDELCASTGRVCGDCSLCCKLLPIAEPELNKPANRWCQHCRPAKGGCSIHDDRPPICRGFACMWLVCPLGDEWRPTRSKMVVSENRSPDPVFNIHVEPGSPDIWRREPYYQRNQDVGARSTSQRSADHATRGDRRPHHRRPAGRRARTRPQPRPLPSAAVERPLVVFSIPKRARSGAHHRCDGTAAGRDCRVERRRPRPCREAAARASP